MSLKKWAEYGWLKPEPTSREEIAELLAIAVRDLKDARVEQISDDRRFEAAFSSARTSANVALRASGYRTSVQMGHHLRTIESLEFTIGIDAKLIRMMTVFSKKRNATSYDSAGNISRHELEEMVRIAAELQKRLTVWLRANHAGLVG